MEAIRAVRRQPARARRARRRVLLRRSRGPLGRRLQLLHRRIRLLEAVEVAEVVGRWRRRGRRGIGAGRRRRSRRRQARVGVVSATLVTGVPSEGAPSCARTPRPTRTPQRKITTETTGRGHEQEHQLFPVQLDFVKAFVLNLLRHNQRDFSTLASVDPRQQLLRLRRRRIERERAFRFRARAVRILGLPVRFAERRVRLGRFRAPERDLERVDRFVHASDAQQRATEQEVRVGEYGER